MTDQALTPACDAWSLGIILYELLTWQVPYGMLDNYMVYEYVQGGGRPEVPRAEDLPGRDTQQVGQDKERFLAPALAGCEHVALGGMPCLSWNLHATLDYHACCTLLVVPCMACAVSRSRCICCAHAAVLGS